MTHANTYASNKQALPGDLMTTLLQLSNDMKIRAINVLSNSLCDNMSTTNGKEDVNTLEFPTLPEGFKISESISSMGVRFPDDFNYSDAIDEMYETFAK